MLQPSLAPTVYLCFVKLSRSLAPQGERLRSLAIVQQWETVSQDMTAICTTFWCYCFYHCLAASAPVSEMSSVTQRFLRQVNWICLSPNTTIVCLPWCFTLFIEHLRAGLCCIWSRFSARLQRFRLQAFFCRFPRVPAVEKNIPEHKFHRVQQLSSFVSSNVRNNKSEPSKVYLT